LAAEASKGDRTVDLSVGTIRYTDTGGSGPVLVFAHGLLMDGSVWRHVVADLRRDFRCVLPTLPLGAHDLPMRPDADLSMRGIARLLGEFLERLDLRDVTLAVNDWGGPLLLIEEPGGDRLSRLVVTSCEVFENVPPGLPGRMIGLAGSTPAGLNFALQQLRLRPLRRLPMTFGWMTKRPVPPAVMDAWLRPALQDAAIRRDLRAYVLSARQARDDLVALTDRLPAFDRPALVAWASEDRVMPPAQGRRLADLLPHGRYVEIADSYTIIPEDQPLELARVIREFLSGDA
jgi:pimeloyl-ACP methyl ester carboxylesterase